jgi:hypothetical protein
MNDDNGASAERGTSPATDRREECATRQETDRVVDATLAVHFALRGLLRFLSHAETVRVFVRACARAALPVKYSQGFNPHPRLSLPLPRTVGVESEDELLALRLFDEKGFAIPSATGRPAATTEGEANRMKAALAEQLPEDIELRDAALMKSGTSFWPESAQYVLPLNVRRRPLKSVRGSAAHLLARETAIVERVVPDRRRSRRLDVRPFVQAIQFEDTDMVVTCGIGVPRHDVRYGEHSIGHAGSIRVDELLRLLDLKVEDLAGSIRRRHVTWTIT